MLTGSADDDTSGSEDECDQGNTTTITNSFGGALTDIQVQCKLDYINYRKVSNMFYNVGTSTCTSTPLRTHDLHDSSAEQSIICVICDSCFEWYHFSCAGVITPPKMTYWFCRSCFAAAKNVD